MGSRTPTCGTQALAESDPHPELDNQTRKEPQRRLTGLLLLPEQQMIPASAARTLLPASVCPPETAVFQGRADLPAAS